MRKLNMDELNRKSVQECKNASKIPIIAILENIRSAYNVGSVFRTADAFLLEKIILIGYTAKPPHKEIKKTALGAEDSVAWEHYTSSLVAIEKLKSLQYNVYAVEQTENSISLEKVMFNSPKKIAVLFGNEVSGVEQDTILQCDGTIEIPQMGMKHSLNIATAAGIVLWELIRNQIPSKLQI